MPYDYFDYAGFSPDSTSQMGLGPDDQYAGDTAEEFYDYLMTPRKHKRWSGSGAIKHFGPDRYASISKDDAAMADILMKQMEQEQQFEFNEGVRGSEMARRKAADELMMPQGRGGGSMEYTPRKKRLGMAGGEDPRTYGPGEAEFTSDEPVTVQIGGGMPTGAPPGPPPELTEGQRTLIGGQFGESRVEAAKQNQYGRPRQSSPPTQSQVVNARAELESTTMDLMNAASFDEAWASLTPEQMIDKARKDRQNIPPNIVEALGPWMEANLKWNAYSQPPQGERENWGGGR